MADRISTDGSSNMQASTAAAKPAKGEAKGKQILVLGDKGGLDVTSRKTGLGTSIKRLAVRFAVLFTTKNRSYWNKALGLDQDNRAAKATEQFSNRIRADDDPGTAPTRKKPSYAAITTDALDAAIATHNDRCVDAFFDHGFKAVIGLMAANGKTEAAEEMGQAIVKAAKLEAKDKMLSEVDLIAKLNEFKTLLESPGLPQVGWHKKEKAEEMIDCLGDGLPGKRNTDNQEEQLYTVLDSITSFFESFESAADRRMARQFCTLQAKVILSEREDGTDTATKFTKFYLGEKSVEAPEKFWVFSEVRAEIRQSVGRSQAAKILHAASCAMLGKK